MRFWNNAILENTHAALEEVLRVLSALSARVQ